MRQWIGGDLFDYLLIPRHLTTTVSPQRCELNTNDGCLAASLFT